MSKHKLQELHLMTDAETTGTDPGCGILSLAIVPFYTHLNLEPFYQTYTLESNEKLGLVNDPTTMKWWREQPKEAQEEAFSGTVSIRTGLYSIIDYLTHLPDAERIVWWCKGASFDFPILKEAFKRAGMVAPWEFRNLRCYRTLAKTFPYVVAIEPRGFIQHHALWDAKHQAEHATALLNWSQRFGAS